MPAKGTVTLNSHVYGPGSSAGDIQRWWDRSSGVSNGFNLLSQRLYEGENKTSPSTKIQFKLKLNTLADESSACVCEGSILGSNTMDLTVSCYNGGDKAGRTELLAQIRALVLTDVFAKSVEDLEPVY
jgi:hypothetical protein